MMPRDLCYAMRTSRCACDASKLGCLVPIPAESADATPSPLLPDPLVRPELPHFSWDTCAFPCCFSTMLLALRRLRADPVNPLGALPGPGNTSRRRPDRDEDDAWTGSDTSSAKGCICMLSLE